MGAVNLRNSIQLYKLVKNHIPVEVVNNEDELQFIQKIILSMDANEYVQSVMLMSGKTLAELATLEPASILEMFTVGLAENKIISLVGYMQGLGL